MSAEINCWRSIGVGGDRSCPELVQHVHCRNCPVVGAAAEGLRQRPAPAGYFREMADAVAQPAASRQATQTALVFRLGRDWLALDTACVVETAADRAVHRIPHRTGFLAGLVNVRGELLLAVHLGPLLDVTPALPGDTGRHERRLVVIAHEGDTWAFAADQVEGVLPMAAADASPPAATLPPALAPVVRGTVPWREERVNLLAAKPLFDLLRAQVAA